MLMEQLSINIQNAGTLKELLGNTTIKEIQYLQLSGYLNGDDIRYLRKILSSPQHNRVHLDLLNTSILNGGGSYIYHYEIDLETCENEIGDYMFSGCCNLLSIILPRNITHIGDAAFQNCERLFRFELTNQIKEIEKNVFKDCSSLKYIKIGENVKVIGEKAFANCCNLVEIYCLALKPPYVHVTTFDGINLQDCELHTKSCCLKAYKENEQWKHFIKEEIQFLQQPITNKQLSVSMFDTFFDKCKNEFVYQRGEMQYDNLYDKIKKTSNLKILCELSKLRGVAPNAADFKIVAMTPNTLFGFKQLLTKMGALIALKIWHETVNYEYSIATDIALYKTAQNIIKLIS